jgi:RNA polymerase sigma-70 factor (ECF subfamily)
LVPFDFETLFRSEFGRIARVVARITRDPARAEDLAIEAFWRLWQRPRAQGSHAGAWVHRTAVRLALDELRRRARRTRYEQALALLRRSPTTPDELFSTREDQGRVRAVLAVMRRAQAELLILRSDGVPYDELAAVLSLNPASVGTLLGRARAAFRKEYVRRYGEHA